MVDSTESNTCAYVGCDKEGKLSCRMGSSMYSFRIIVCDEHEKELD